MPTQPRNSSRRRSAPPPKPAKQKQDRSRRLRNLPALVIAAVIATVADHAVRQWRTPAPQAHLPWPGADPADPQHVQELQALHHEPSDEFCAAGPPLVCAHGGDSSGGAPANSLEAFQAALKQGVPCLEVDVARTSDGRLVVLHPRDLTQLLGASSAAGDADKAADEQQLPQVGDYRWEQLAALSWPGGQQVATAEEVLQLAVPAAQHITLDVKMHAGQGDEDDTEAVAKAVVDLIGHTACGQCLVWAKSDALVQRVKELSPAQPVGYIVLNETADARSAGMHHLLRLPRAEVAGLHHSMASAEVTQALRAAGQRVHVWTANTVSRARAVLDAGVHAVVTDHSRQLLAALDSRLHACRAREVAAAAAAAAAETNAPAADEL